MRTAASGAGTLGSCRAAAPGDPPEAGLDPGAGVLITADGPADIEALLAIRSRNPEGLAAALDGGFAVAVWDATAGRLTLLRDPAGIKPLYWADHGGAVVFASECQALVPALGGAPPIDQEAVAEYLGYRYPSCGRTLLAQVRELDPGGRLVWERGTLRLDAFWKPPYGERDGNPARAEWVERIASALESTVRAEMGSPRPPGGILLSGGIDSSLLAALAVRASTRPLRSWSVGPDDSAFDESPRARAVARALGIEHTVRTVGGREYSEALPRTIAANGAPLHHPNSVALLVLSGALACEAPRVIMGEGADSSFGNRVARKLRLAQRVGALLPRAAGARALSAMGSRPAPRQLAEILSEGEDAFVARSNLFAAEPVVATVGAVPGAAKVSRLRDAYFRQASALEPIDRALFYYQKTEMLASFNVFGQVLASAGVEAEMPFGDRRVQDVSCRIPWQDKSWLRVSKPLLREAARRHLPADVLRWPKMSFGFPMEAWFRPGGALAPWLAVLREPRTLDRGWLRPEGVRQVIAEHQAGTHAHGEGAIWTALNLELWARLILDGDEPGGLSPPAG